MAQHIHVFSPIADFAVELIDDVSQYIFLVSGASLRQASPVWMKALDQNTSLTSVPTISVKGQVYRKTVVNNISPATLGIFFNILHYRSSQVPPSINFNTLHEFAMLADRYDCKQALSPFTQLWIPNLIKVQRMEVHRLAAIPQIPEEWLLIGNVFEKTSGCSDIVKEASKKFIANVLVVHSGGPNESPLLYQWAVNRTYGKEGAVSSLRKFGDDDFIISERLKAIRLILMPFHQFVRRMLDISLHDGNYNPNDQCRIPECFSIALGSLIVSLRKNKLEWLLEEKLVVPKASVADLVGCLDMLRMKTLAFSSTTRKHSQKWNWEPYRKNSILMNQKYYNDAKSPCVLAVKLASLQEDSRGILNKVKGYEVVQDHAP
ncbi:hypothetical protein TWF281_001666 [Arthrobotrys megalospora]